jgi:transcriptional regulator with XRE-family HTH domain
VSKSDELIGSRIREAREARGLSQPVLAEVLGITKMQISKKERGIDRITAEQLARLAKLLKRPVSYFLDGIA